MQYHCHIIFSHNSIMTNKDLNYFFSFINSTAYVVFHRTKILPNGAKIPPYSY